MKTRGNLLPTRHSQDQLTAESAVVVLAKGIPGDASSAGKWIVSKLSKDFLMGPADERGSSSKHQSAHDGRRAQSVVQTTEYHLPHGLHAMTFTAAENTQGLHAWEPILDGLGQGEETSRLMLQVSLRFLAKGDAEKGMAALRRELLHEPMVGETRAGT